jgi:hypothetical protein
LAAIRYDKSKKKKTVRKSSTVSLHTWGKNVFGIIENKKQKIIQKRTWRSASKSLNARQLLGSPA